jgi:hypothetical protein
MQFKVPQNVQREDKIVGPLTLKQLLICAGGGVVAYGIYVALGRYYIWITWLPPVAIVVIITLAFAFARPLDLSFTQWLLLWFEYSLLPRKRMWFKSSGEVIKPSAQKKAKKKKGQKESEQKMDAMTARQRKLEELNKFLEAEKKGK